MTEFLHADARELHAPFSTILATCSPDQAFHWITAALSAQSSALRASNARLVAYTGSTLALDWFDATVASPVKESWGDGAALLGASWPRIAAWLQAGGPRMLMALDTLIAYRKPAANMSPLAQIAAPVLPQAPEHAELMRSLAAVLAISNTPRIRHAIEAIQSRADEILRNDSRGVSVRELPILFITPTAFEHGRNILARHEAVRADGKQSVQKLI